MEINFENIKKAHFIGIGGIGISAMARLFHISGKTITGSDMSDSPIITDLREKGIHIYSDHDSAHISPETELVIYTIAIPESNPELIRAKELNIPLLTYPQALTVASRNMTTIAISGTHGKTTTTAMLAEICIDAGLDPTVIVGSLLKGNQSNLIVGNSDYFIVEACEYRRSFLNLYPKILVITNIDEDHLDYYKDIVDIQSAFRELAIRIPKDGCIVCNPHDPRVKVVVEGLDCKIVDYTIYISSDLKLKVPGEHNRQNAAATKAVANFLQIKEEGSKKSLEKFGGTWRRFDFKGKNIRGALLYDDYAHHPEEIKATIAGVRELYSDKKVIVLFQPHLFSRTKDHLEEFGKVLSKTDHTYLLPIYPAREVIDPSISSDMVCNEILQANGQGTVLKNLVEAQNLLQTFDDQCVVLTMGAGDIYTIHR